MDTENVNTAYVSDWTGIPVATLRWWRHKGIGPKSFKLGPRKVMYRKQDVADWMEAQYQATDRSA